MATTVQDISPHLAALTAPALLKALPNWLVWRFEHLAGEKKARKVPYYANGTRRFGTNGSAKDRAQLVTFEAAKRTAIRGGFSGIGIALLAGDNITALDFDDCVTANGINPDVLSAITGTYSEFSPSGKGVRAFIQSELGNRKSPTSDTQFGFETFSSKGFVTVTGNFTDDCELTGSENIVAPPSPQALTLIESRFSYAQSQEFTGTVDPKGLTQDHIAQCLDVLDSSADHDTWLHIGMALHHETGGDGFEFWNTWSANSVKYPGRQTLEERWHSFGQSTLRPITANFLLDLTKDKCDVYLDFCTAQPTEFGIIPEPLPPANGHFHIRTAADFMAQTKSTSWFIKGILPKAQLGVIYGESASGKSFLALDMCAALSQGKDWNNCRVSSFFKILYVVAEGSHGFNNRLRAYCHQYGTPHKSLNIDIISDAVPNLVDPASVRALTDDIKRFGPYDLIVMDTFAQVTAGANENSGEDMGKALANARALGAIHDSMVLLIHHSGKDTSRGARGHSSLRAACDFEAEVTRFENDRAFQITKLKDGRDGEQFGFKLLDVILGEDEDGDNITSCIVEFGGVRARAKKVKTPRGNIEKLVMSVAHELMGFETTNIDQQALIDTAISQLPYDESKRDQRKKNVLRAMEALVLRGFMRFEDGILHVGEKDNV